MKRSKKLMAVITVSTSATAVLSLINIALGSLALVYRLDCSAGDLSRIKGSNFLAAMIYNQYIQDDICKSKLKVEDLTNAYTVYIMTVVLMSVSCASVVASFNLLIGALNRKNCPTYVLVSTYVHVVLCLTVFTVEMILAIHLGLDYGLMTSKMNEYKPGLYINYTYDTLRHGILFLICLLLKGFVAPISNLLLLPLIVILSHDEMDNKPREDNPQHSIHSRGVINAFDQSKNEDQWQLQPEWSSNFAQGRYSSNRSSPHRAEARGPVSHGRPFTYLQPDRWPPSSNTQQADRTRSQEPPLPVPIPAPDYSPRPKLKSALKPSYE